MKPDLLPAAATAMAVGWSRRTPWRKAAASSVSTAVGPPRRSPAQAAASQVTLPVRWIPSHAWTQPAAIRRTTARVSPPSINWRVVRTPAWRSASAPSPAGRDCRGRMKESKLRQCSPGALRECLDNTRVAADNTERP